MESNAVGKEACPKCQESGNDTSGDNLVRYDDGHGHCFACGFHQSEKGEGKKVRSKKSKSTELLQMQCVRLGKRKITEATCKHMGYGIATYQGEPVQVANYMRDGAVVAQKVRTADKDFVFLGEPKRSGLFGQHLWRDGGKRLIITEGEIDALTVSQLMNNKWPVVSVPNGAAGAAKAVAKEIEWVSKYERVVLAFDMDDPGQEAAKEVAALLPPGKVAIAHLPAKDPNEALVEGRSDALIQSLWEAKVYRPDGVVDVESLIEQALAPIEVGLPWPWESLTIKTHGRRRREIYGFGAGTGVGKSTIFKQIAQHIIETEQTPVGMLMLEENPAHTLKTVAGMVMGKRVHVPGVKYDTAKLRKTLDGLAGRVYFYDHFGAATFDTIKDRVRYMVHALGVRDIFLDHLTALAASVGDDDERRAIDRMMAELSAMAQELNITLYFVSHLATPQGASHEEGGRVMERHFRGSRSIGYWSHFLFGIERDKQDPDGVITFRVLKDRYTGDSAGLTFGLEYDTDTGRLTECPLPDEEDDDKPAFKSTEGEY